MSAERLLPGLKNRILLLLTRIAPGATTLRVCLNRWRGVNIGKDVWIGYDAIIETSCPHFVTIRDGAAIGMRVTLIAHYREQQGDQRDGTDARDEALPIPLLAADTHQHDARQHSGQERNP